MATVNNAYTQYLDQIKNNNNQQAQNAYNTSVDKINNAYQQQQNNLNLEGTKLNQQFDLNKQNLADNLYKQAELNKVDAGNRGIGNSLQYQAMQNANQLGYNKDLTNLTNTHQNNLADLNNRLNALSQDKATGLQEAHNTLQNSLTSNNNAYLNSYLDLLMDANNKEWQQQQTQADRDYNTQQTQADRDWQKEFLLWQQNNLK